ncbi:methyltransferase [Rhodoblastus sp.]|uniref:methyltransferase family protein n=1 Tax=Rhodoblastus sp. TaxID=1962975 RepID=UPI0026025D78|nr:methyltransferase [Rhodoblastus sp.]
MRLNLKPFAFPERTSGTFRAELAATVFICLFLSTHLRFIAAHFWPLAVPLILLAGCYALKVALMVWLELRGGTAWDFGHSQKLVISGPYRYNRNPVYLVVVAQFALWFAVVAYCQIQIIKLGGGVGPALFWVAGAALSMIGPWLYYDRVAIPREEKSLTADHGAEFLDYCAQVPRWGVTFAPPAPPQGKAA